MFATIQSKEHLEFHCRVKADPVLSFKNILVYEFVDSVFPDEIKKKVNGELVGVFSHVALDTNGQGYLFDIHNNELSGNVGECEYFLDK